MTPFDRRALLLYLCVAAALAFVDHRVRSDRDRAHVMTEYVPSVLAGTSGAPAKYRVLMPFALNRVATRTHQDPYLVLLASELLFGFAAFVIVHAYLRTWHPPAVAVGGTLALAALLPLTFTNSWIHPDTLPDLFLFTAGCFAVARRRDGLLALVLLVGMFNRETMGFVLLLWGLHRLQEWRSPRTIGVGLGLASICASVYVGLRWVRGFEPYDMWMVSRNLEYLTVLPAGFDPYTRIAGFFWIVLLGVPGWFAVQAVRRADAPVFYRSATIIAGLFIAIAWLFAAIIETRVFVPALPLLLPAALAGFVAPPRTTPSRPART
jgi:hypothetical protein